MELLLVFLVVCVHTAFTKEVYRTYDLESFDFCKYGKEEGFVLIKPWGAVMLRVGHILNKDGSQASRDIHNCKVSIKTQEGFGILAVIEDMKLQGRRNKDYGWDCEGDYVKLSTVGSSSFVQALDRFLPGDIFKKKATEELCGIRNPDSQRFSEIGTSANVLSTLSNDMEVDFHQKQKNRNFVNNSFTIVITTFKHQHEEELCDGRYMCPGSNKYCIHPDYVCDGHYNCAFSSNGADESKCPDSGVSHLPMFTATTTIIMTLACIVAFGLVVCCIFTIIMRAKSRNTTRSGTPIPTTVMHDDATAPPIERQPTLPGYEAVVMSDLEDEQKVSVPPTPAVGEYPPSYDQLFPDGPPKLQGNKVPN